jgi:mono/diheme cytochrome c family protein
MKTFFKVLVGLVIAVILLLGGAYLWATMSSNRLATRTFESHTVDFPIPFPVAPDEATALGLSPGAAEELARTRAIARGEHLVTSRYACVECHGQNFGGGTMIDAFPIGTLLGPNLTAGAGSRTLDYTPADWDRAVRHGILPDGRPSAMPSVDFRSMSDQELSDVVMYIRSFPPVDNTVPEKSLGPLGKVLVATGQLPFSADVIESHTAEHAALPPPSEVSVEFGRHLAGVCSGCHGENFAGGPIPGGDPAWPPARNLTPDPTGLSGWTYENFVSALREGVRPDGTPLRAPMDAMPIYAQEMTEVEIQALWTYLQSLPPVVMELPEGA